MSPHALRSFTRRLHVFPRRKLSPPARTKRVRQFFAAIFATAILLACTSAQAITPPGPATIQTPTPGTGTIVGPGSTPFTWSAGTPAATSFELYLGTTKGASDIYRGGQTSNLGTTVGSIPANGVYIYATLWQKQGGAWKSTSAEYIESGSPTPGVITQPTDGSTLGTTNVQFAWPTGTAGPTAYTLLLGTGGYGTADIFKGGTKATSITVPTIPNNGVTVYAEFQQEINGKWQSSEYNYVESGMEVPGAITSPMPPGPLAGAAQVFTWSLGTGVTAYELRVGRVNGVCSWDIYSSGVLSATTASNHATGLPTDGSTVFVCLVQRIDDEWTSTEYTYTAAP